ncbi:MAG: hypothetical protein COA83_05055 [Methylophaga sp.]|nr:MAG: hypothetical protein COA83_05055 [Methylophaga sp.]
MNSNASGFQLITDTADKASLVLQGNWTQDQQSPNFSGLHSELQSNSSIRHLLVSGADLAEWDSTLMAFLLQCHDYCQANNIGFQTQNLPDGAEKLLEVATAVAAHQLPEDSDKSWLSSLSPMTFINNIAAGFTEYLAFMGEVSIALAKLVAGKANTRMTDFKTFCYDAGPGAFAIISLVSVLVGMILAYLGAVQLAQFGAEVYVADLVVVGTLREMGALMTAVVMAGRTGAAYATQLGTMQTNDEIDAIITMGISPIEFLVIPRILALVLVMPLLTIYANLLGIIGGGIVAGSMGIDPLQYIHQASGVLSWAHISVGLIKSIVFALLIAVAGCRAGINSGRSSAAVGQAATQAVVTSIVYIIIADAAINIIFQQIGM